LKALGGMLDAASPPRAGFEIAEAIDALIAANYTRAEAMTPRDAQTHLRQCGLLSS
jgi:hypothetical protein